MSAITLIAVRTSNAKTFQFNNLSIFGHDIDKLSPDKGEKKSASGNEFYSIGFL